MSKQKKFFWAAAIIVAFVVNAYGALYTNLSGILSVTAEDEEPAPTTATACIGYGSADWSVQYYGAANASTTAGATGTEVVFDGTQDYKKLQTVSVDFSGVETAASGVIFMALMIENGETVFPGWTIKLNEVKINGEAVELTKGYTCSEGIQTRMNIYNTWVTKKATDLVETNAARNYDHNLDDTSTILLDPTVFAKEILDENDQVTGTEPVKTMEVSFYYLPFNKSYSKACLATTSGDWSIQYAGTSIKDITDVTADIFEGGTYTVKLDFTGLAAGKMEGIQFTALYIDNGENAFPDFKIKIESIKINNEAINFTKGYTCSDDSIVTRMNIYNSWIGEEDTPDKLVDSNAARSYDGSFDNATAKIVNTDDFSSVETYEVTFKYEYVGGEVNSFLSYSSADAENGVNIWDIDTAPEGTVTTNAVIDGEGSYKVGYDFSALATKPNGIAFTALMINDGENAYPGYLIKITSIKINGSEITFKKGYTSSDDGKVTRMNIYNSWVSQLPEYRTYDNKLNDVTSTMINTEGLGEINSIEVLFDFIYGYSAPAKEVIDDFDYEGALLKDYNAYFAIQSENYIFRNPWNESNYGKENECFSHFSKTDDGEVVDYGGSFEDVEIKGNGTYSVKATIGEKAFEEDTYFRYIYISTDIPSKLIIKNRVQITDVNIKIGSQTTQQYLYLDTTGDYLLIILTSTYITAIGRDSIAYTMPAAGDVMTASFTIAGLKTEQTPDSSSESESASTSASESTSASTSTSTSTSEKTSTTGCFSYIDAKGGFTLIAIIALAASAIVFFQRKRKVI